MLRSINPATNPQYYVDNDDPNAAEQPYAASALVYNLQYDGFTMLLTAQTNVSAGITYHVKIAIADAPSDDNRVDSAVFIKTESFPCQSRRGT